MTAGRQVTGSFRAVIGGLALVVVLGGCGDDDEGAQGTTVESVPGGEEPAEEPAEESSEEVAVERVSVRSAFTPSGGLTGPFLYAEAEGCYEEEGLQVEVSDGKGSLATAQDVAQKNVDFGQVGSSVVAQAVSQGVPVISVAQQYGRLSFGVIVPEESQIESIADLEGRSVITSPGSPETVFLPAALAALDIDPSTVEVLSVDASQKGATYTGGLADALGTSVPFFLPLVDSARPSEAVLFDDAGVVFPDFSLVVHPDTLRDRPDVVERFLRGSFRCFPAAFENPERVGEILAEARPAVTAIEEQVASLEAYEEFVCGDGQAGMPVGAHSPEDWTVGLEIFQEFGDLEGDVGDLDQFFTNQFFEGDDPVSEETCP